jgi:hypothetical protein
VYVSCPSSGTVFVIDDEVTEVELNWASNDRPSSFSLHQNYPNPFNALTHIPLSVPVGQEGRVSLQIFNIRGQLIRHLPLPALQAGKGVAVWDGRDDAGRAVASGLYMCRLNVGHRPQITKMLLLR